MIGLDFLSEVDFLVGCLMDCFEEKFSNYIHSHHNLLGILEFCLDWCTKHCDQVGKTLTQTQIIGCLMGKVNLVVDQYHCPIAQQWTENHGGQQNGCHGMKQRDHLDDSHSNRSGYDGGFSISYCQHERRHKSHSCNMVMNWNCDWMKK